MSKSRVILIFSALIYLLAGCSSSTAGKASPQNIFKNNPNADFFVLNDTVYENAEHIDWLNKITLKEGKLLGKIIKTGVKKNFKDWNATKLDVNTVIYELEGRKDIVLAKIDGKYKPYLKIIEG